MPRRVQPPGLQLFGGGGSCPSDNQDLLEAYYLLCALALSPDLLGTQGGWSPSPPSPGPGQLGGGGGGWHREGGERDWTLPGAQAPSQPGSALQPRNSCSPASFNALGSCWRSYRGPVEGRLGRSQARSPVPLAIPPVRAYAAPSEGVGGRLGARWACWRQLWEPWASGHPCGRQKKAAMWRAPRSAYIRGSAGPSVHQTRHSWGPQSLSDARRGVSARHSPGVRSSISRS